MIRNKENAGYPKLGYAYNNVSFEVLPKFFMNYDSFFKAFFGNENSLSYEHFLLEKTKNKKMEVKL